MNANQASLPSSQGGNVRFSDVPDASSVPPLLRRRLNFMGRACISEMLQHLENHENLPIVFCSRHGDIERTLKVLIDAASGAPASPMDFSLAVHNAIAGVLSIHWRITANISSIATSEGALVPVLMEALGLLSAASPKILCIICDVSLPAIYRTPGDEADYPFVACFTVTTGGRVNLQLSYAGSTGPEARLNEAPLAFVDFLASAEPEFRTVHNAGCWVVRRQTP